MENNKYAPNELQQDALKLCMGISETIIPGDKFLIVNVRFNPNANRYGAVSFIDIPDEIRPTVINYNNKRTIEYLMSLNVIDASEDGKLFDEMYVKEKKDVITGQIWEILNIKYDFKGPQPKPKFYSDKTMEGKGFKTVLVDVPMLAKLLTTFDNPFIPASNIESVMATEIAPMNNEASRENIAEILMKWKDRNKGTVLISGKIYYIKSGATKYGELKKVVIDRVMDSDHLISRADIVRKFMEGLTKVKDMGTGIEKDKLRREIGKEFDRFLNTLPNELGDSIAFQKQKKGIYIAVAAKKA